MTTAEILVAIRECSFDRYPIPVLVLKAKANKAVSNNSTNFTIHPINVPSPPDFTYGYTPDGDTDRLDNLSSALIAGGYPIAFTGYYSSQDAPNSLLLFSNATLAKNLTFFRRFFLSDTRIKLLLLDYFATVLKSTTTTNLTLDDHVALCNDQVCRHMTLWCAIQLVDLRRLSEVAQLSLGSTSFSDGTGLPAGSNLSYPGQSINLTIGSVFSLSDDNSITSKYFQDDFNRVGSDNVLGDKESWWFKLFLALRKKIEREYQDFSFRDDNAIQSTAVLERELNYLSYFDSFPYTLSPLSRGILDQR